MADQLTIHDLRNGGKIALSHALSAIECHEGLYRHAEFLDTAVAEARAHVIGLTGPPGVGKSTLMNSFIHHWRSQNKSVGIIAVDPSSRITGGALLGDRARLKSDPEDNHLFIRSFATRNRLGGLSDHAIAAMVLMRAVMDCVIIETVGIGQSEMDVMVSADTIVLCIQPGSGDALQFMKAGVIEMPDIFVVTKADMTNLARRTHSDLEGALSLNLSQPHNWQPPICCVSAKTGEGLSPLFDMIEGHWQWLYQHDHLKKHRDQQAKAWIYEFLRIRFGEFGLKFIREKIPPDSHLTPFKISSSFSEIFNDRLSKTPHFET